MPLVKVGTENTADIEIHYRDHGAGKPIVLSHGYPLDGNSWEPRSVLPYWRAPRAPAGRIVLAGEHTDTWSGYMNGAVRGGQRAAALVAEG